ncbi:type IIL restriction-modification enzyme MmeI [Arthrobacter sp. Hiyo1]|uniref:type IIL restriction-modification enzyme MmeI n=1 Tax=Arthrobacter sp. Hiyo1 TaxID=1588020 RepID=UPI0030F459EF
MPKDGGHLLLEPRDRDAILDKHPEAARYIKRFAGAAEFINDIERYCLWIADDELEEAQAIPAIAKRLEAVSKWRLESEAATTVDYAVYPNRFKQNAYKPTESIVVPSISSSRRRYIPMGYLDAGVVISSKGFAIYDAEPWTFAMLTSQMHMAWLGQCPDGCASTSSTALTSSTTTSLSHRSPTR